MGDGGGSSSPLPTLIEYLPKQDTFVCFKMTDVVATKNWKGFGETVCLCCFFGVRHKRMTETTQEGHKEIILF